DEVDRSSSMPLIVLTPSSILSLISVSICSGAPPGCTVVMRIVGKSTFGKRSTPSRVNENAPITVSDRIRTVAKTGRLTQRAASHCIQAPGQLEKEEVRTRKYRDTSNFFLRTSYFAIALPSTSFGTFAVATRSPA